MGKLIIIDGVDGVGKGYLISKISKVLPGAIIIKICDRPRNSSMEERNKIKIYYQSVLNAVIRIFPDNIIIMDRFFSSELVYSIKRGYEAFDDPFFKVFEDTLMMKTEHLFVHVVRDKKEIENAFDTRGEEYVTKDEIDILTERYQKFYNETQMNKMQITSDEFEKVIEYGKHK
jgi:thymidylate kinase